MSIEQTLVLVKPDGVERGLVGEIISRFERRGLRLVAMRMMQFDEKLVKTHYQEHVEKPFFPDLQKFITRAPVVAMVIEGDAAVTLVRTMMGATKFTEAAPGTIRGDFAYSFTENLVHGSDSVDSAKREIELFFDTDQIFS